MRLNLDKMLEEINDNDDVVFAEVNGVFVFITKSGSMANNISDAVKNKTQSPKGKKVAHDE